ncbi:MAG: Redoxin domain protein [Planctomycetaceae bacterium]|nr:Redoxin domain protein [Planctomycetaceae bacterium]
MPRIKAQGWLNGEEPTSKELANKVLVIDAWASWCGPCRHQAPEMVLLHEKYQPQGVEFIGLTMETEEDLEPMQNFLKLTGITWKNAYGAEETLRELGANYIPMVWVVDRHNQIVWNQASSIPLEEGIREALAKP